MSGLDRVSEPQKYLLRACSCPPSDPYMIQTTEFEVDQVSGGRVIDCFFEFLQGFYHLPG
jgi:hypothetical protein